MLRSEFIEERNGINSNDELARSSNREDTDKTYLKLDWAFKDSLTRHLVKFNELLFNDSISQQTKLNLLKDNNRLLVSLNSLPVIIDERHREKHLVDKVKKDMLDILKGKGKTYHMMYDICFGKFSKFCLILEFSSFRKRKRQVPGRIDQSEEPVELGDRCD